MLELLNPIKPYIMGFFITVSIAFVGSLVWKYIELEEKLKTTETDNLILRGNIKLAEEANLNLKTQLKLQEAVEKFAEDLRETNDGLSNALKETNRRQVNEIKKSLSGVKCASEPIPVDLQWVFDPSRAPSGAKGSD